MDRKDFDRLLAQGGIPSVLLFEGEEEHMKQAALGALQKKLLPEGLEDLNRTLLDAPETDQIIAAAETLPFMADRRLVIVRDHPALTGRAEADDRLAEFIIDRTVQQIFHRLLYQTGERRVRKSGRRAVLLEAVLDVHGDVVDVPAFDQFRQPFREKSVGTNS